MEPITIGVAVGTAVLTQLTKKLMEKAADPEKVGKAVNWVFSSVDHFLKIRKQKKAKETPIPAPPPASPPAAPPAKVEAAEVEKKTAAVERNAKSLLKENSPPATGGVYLAALDDFTLDQLTEEITSLLNQLQTYLGNLRFEEEKAAQYGGPVLVPTIVMNTIRLQQQEIAKRVLRLNTCMEKAYGVAANDLEVLLDATQA